MNDDLLDELEDIDDIPQLASTIRSYISNGVVFAEQHLSLRGAAGLLEEASVGCIVIGDTTDVLGVVSERDIVRAVAGGVDLDATTVSDVATRTLKWATSDSSVTDVAEEMMENYVRHVMVREGDTLVGVVSMRDLLGALLD